MLGMLKAIFKQADGVPDYHLGPKFDGSGAGLFVLRQEFGNPSQLYRGPGRNAGALRVWQHPQVMVPLFAPTSGLGGTQAGTVILQPLTTSEDIGI